jgi:ribulose-phosphate 3-epimerase
MALHTRWTHAERDALAWVQAGASRVVVHAESPDAEAALHALQDARMLASLPTTVGVALSCSASASALDAYSGLYDFVQVMGIEHIGKQGEPFDERALMLVQEIRELYPDTHVQVDGGVRAENAAAIVAAGATSLVVGSAVFNAADPHAAIAALMSTANKK